MSDTSVDIPRPDRNGHTPIGVSRCPGCLPYFEVSFCVLRLISKFELLSNLVFEYCWSCGDLVWICCFVSIFKRYACDDFGEVNTKMKDAVPPHDLFFSFETFNLDDIAESAVLQATEAPERLLATDLERRV
jgi:hypothetical protein